MDFSAFAQQDRPNIILKKDPSEIKNLARNPRYSEILTEKIEAFDRKVRELEAEKID